MNKKEVSEAIHQSLGVQRFMAYSFIDLLIEVVTENLEKGDKVVLSNFGTFKVEKRQKKRVINPNNNDAMIIPGRKVVKFYPSRKLKDAIANL